MRYIETSSSHKCTKVIVHQNGLQFFPANKIQTCMNGHHQFYCGFYSTLAICPPIKSQRFTPFHIATLAYLMITIHIIVMVMLMFMMHHLQQVFAFYLLLLARERENPIARAPLFVSDDTIQTFRCHCISCHFDDCN